MINYRTYQSSERKIIFFFVIYKHKYYFLQKSRYLCEAWANNKFKIFKRF